MVLGVAVPAIRFFTPKLSSSSQWVSLILQQWVHNQIKSSSLSDERGSLDDNAKSSNIDRRKLLVISSVGLLAGAIGEFSRREMVLALKGRDYGKTKMNYPDYAQTSSGLQYKDLRPGNGPIPKPEDIVVNANRSVDWDGYTIGYYGRIFEARNKTKGGSFEPQRNHIWSCF